MAPRILSAQHEEGYYIVWSTEEWRKEGVRSSSPHNTLRLKDTDMIQRQLTLHYADLETNPSTGLSPM